MEGTVVMSTTSSAVQAPPAGRYAIDPAGSSVTFVTRLVSCRAPHGKRTDGTRWADRHRLLCRRPGDRLPGRLHRRPLCARHHDDARDGSAPAFRPDHRARHQSL